MRNRIIVLAMLLVFVAAAGAQAEGAGLIAKGIKAGVNIAGNSGSDTDSHHKWRTAFVGGGFLTYGLSGALAIQPEILYAMKGYKWEDAGYKETGKYNYIEIPILLKYMVQMQSSMTPSLFVGLAPAFLMSAETDWDYGGEIGAILGDTGTEDVKDYTKSFDLGLVFGGGFDFALGNGKLLLDYRYTMGLTKIDDSADKLDVKNKAISITAGYGF